MTHVADTTVHEYVDDELDAHNRALVDAHCAECAECAARLEALGALRLRLAELPRAIEPPAELLSGIHARLDAPAVIPLPARSPSRAMLAAAAVLLIAASSALTAVVMRSLDPQPAPTAQATPDGSDARLVAVTEIESRYLSAIDELERALAAQRSALSPETITVIEANLAIIDRAVAEARDALYTDPSSSILAEMLRAGYERKLDVLRSARAHTVQM